MGGLPQISTLRGVVSLWTNLLRACYSRAMNRRSPGSKTVESVERD